MSVGAIPRASLPGRTAIAAIALVMAAFAGVFARVPWPRIDLYNNLQRAEDFTWPETVRAAFASGVEYRPLLIIATKLAYTIGGLHLWFYKTLVLVECAAVLWLLLMLWQPAGWKRIAAAVVALTCLLGLHTSRVLFLFLPLNFFSASMILVIGAALIVIEPAGRRVQWLLLPLTVGSLLALEFGILIVPLVLIAWWLGAPGITWRGVVSMLVGLGLYIVTRRLFGASVGDLSSPESGLGFEDMSPQQIKLTFAHAPWLFWLYNVGSSVLTVLASEPRDGKFKFVSALLRGTAAHWQWLHAISSLATSVVVMTVLARGTLARRDRVLAAMGLVLFCCGSALGFLYTRDRIGLFAGLGYAMLVYVAVAVLLERTSASTIRRPLAAVLVAALGVCWVWRTGEAGVQLRDRAWEYYLEWTVRYHHEGPETPLLRALRERVTTHRPANPRLDARWTYQWFEREFDRIDDN